MSLIQNIANAEADALALSSFLNDNAQATVVRRIAGNINTLQYYIDYLNALKAMVANPTGTVTINGTSMKTIAQSIKDALDTTGIQNGVSDGLVAVKNANMAGGIPRTQADKNSDYISVKDFGAKGDGSNNDTQSILAAVNYANTNKKKVHFPAGRYWFDGGAELQESVIIHGDGRNTTVIISRLAQPTNGYLFNASGWGSGLENIGFINGATQTGGSYVLLSGVSSYIHDFMMLGDFNGILMTGVIGRIRHGWFRECVKDAIRIRAEGGDTSQIIDDVLMGAVNDRTMAKAGIRVKNSSALMITNTSVITMGVGLLIEASNSDQNVFSLYANNCFFDNCVTGMQVYSYGNGGVYRCRFANCWFSSATYDGVAISGDNTAIVEGIHFESCHLSLNGGAGLSTGKNCSDIAVVGGEICQNLQGVYLNFSIDRLKIIGATIGKGAGLNGNKANGIALNSVVVSNSVIANNVLIGNGNPIANSGNNPTLALTNNIGANNSTVFIPTLTVANVISDATYQTQSGSYTITNNIVTCDFKIILSKKGTKAGAIGIALPVNAKIDNEHCVTGQISNIASVTGLSSAVTIVTNSTTMANLVMTNSTGFVNLTTDNLTDNSVIFGRVTYFTQ